MKLDVTGWQEVSRAPYACPFGSKGVILPLARTGPAEYAVKLEGGEKILLRKP